MRVVLFAERGGLSASITADVLDDNGAVVAHDLPRVVRRELTASFWHLDPSASLEEWEQLPSVRDRMRKVAQMLHRLGYQVLDSKCDPFQVL
jgi:hypothetical protein